MLCLRRGCSSETLLSCHNTAPAQLTLAGKDILVTGLLAEAFCLLPFNGLLAKTEKDSQERRAGLKRNFT